MIVYGHRGARGEAPENTLEGFEFAFKQGIIRFELDIQLSADGKLIVMHDRSLKLTTGVEKNVYQLTAEEIVKLDARQNTAPWPTACHPVVLDTLLERLPDVVHWQLEVKSDDKKRLNILCNRLLELLHKKDIEQKVVITSSDRWLLNEIKRRDKKIDTGYVAEKRFPHPVKTAHNLGCQYLILNEKLCDKAIVEEAHNYKLHVSCWTVNNIHVAVNLKTIGIDSLITDYPTSTQIYFEKNEA